jgi:hypothetical protein
MKIIEKEISFIYKGIMKKPIIEMSEIEREEYYNSNVKKVKKRLFLINQPMVYEKNGKVLAEYSNGKIEIVRNA